METKEVETKAPEVKGFETMDWDERKEVTDKLIKHHVYGAMGVGLIPVPVLDLLALTGLQLNLLYKLSKRYGVGFSKEKGKKIIGVLIGSSIPVSMAAPLSSLLKVIPVIGQTTGALTMTITAGASTYALGKVFVQHFESGGTFLDFDPEKVKGHFAEHFREGQKVAAELKKAAPQKSG